MKLVVLMTDVANKDSEQRGKFLLELYRKALRLSGNELYEYFLDHAVNITKSSIGFFHFVSLDQNTIILTAWNEEALKNCTANYATHYPIEQAGNWADCVRLKRPVIYNDFDQSPNQKGLPEGHVSIRRLLSAPIIEDGKALAIFGVGNKVAPYEEGDAVQLSLVASELSKIIKQRRVEGELRESNENYRSLFSNMLDGFAYCKMIFDEKGKPIDFIYIEVNDAFVRLTGLKRENIVGKRVTEAIPGIKEANPELFDIYGRVANTGKEEKIELFFKPLSIWLTISVYSPKKGYFAAVFENITLYKKAVEEIRIANEELEERVRKRTEEVSSERQRLYNVLETLPAYVVLLDKDYKVPFANKVFRERFGESYGRRCHEYLFNLDSPCENCETYKVLKTNGPHRWEWTGPDGRDYDIYDFPFTEVDGSTLILEMGIDITERKKLEKQLKDSERMVAIGQTAGMVGHDIRNPLQAITGDVYLAKADLATLPDSEEKESVQESLVAIEKNAEYINKIVADLQDFAKPLSPCVEETDIKTVLDDLPGKNGLPENIQKSVKVRDEARRVMADSAYIKRIVGNLVTNAAQAMPNGGKLLIDVFKEGDDTVITVEDTGTGIPEASKSKLFQPLFTTKSRGQGFGLAVVKRLTEALNGTVTFESQMGRGTKFIIRLPPIGKAV